MNTRTVVLTLLTLLATATVAGAFPAPASAQGRGLEIPTRRDGDRPRQLPLRQVFAGVAIRDYQHPRWVDLQNPLNDLDSISAVLGDFGFETPESLILRDAEASDKGVERLVSTRLRQETDSLTQLVFFFAGHGHTADGGPRGDRKTGYILPHDAHPDSVHTWFPVRALLEAIADAPARHILVILDSCHAGIALSGSLVERAAPPPRYDGETEAQFDLRGWSRTVLTSAGPSELAADIDPRRPSNSLFAVELIEALRSPDVVAEDSVNAELFVEADELAAVVRRRVSNRPDSDQTPDHGVFRNNEWGQLILEVEMTDYERAVRQFSRALVRKDLADAEVWAGEVASVDEKDVESEFVEIALLGLRGQWEEFEERMVTFRSRGLVRDLDPRIVSERAQLALFTLGPTP